MNTTFEDALRGLSEMNVSTDDRRLIELLARHAEEEHKILEEYRVFSEGTGSPAIVYLVNLIIDDERRHHRTLAELANTIVWGGWTSSPSPEEIPDIHRTDLDTSLRQKTKTLLKGERSDERELRKLIREFGSAGDAPLWKLIIELMLLDTKKHQRILRFILENA